MERSDAGHYWCQVYDQGETEMSQQVWLTVEGEEAGPQGQVFSIAESSVQASLPHHGPLGTACARFRWHPRHPKTLEN